MRQQLNLKLKRINNSWYTSLVLAIICLGIGLNGYTTITDQLNNIPSETREINFVFLLWVLSSDEYMDPYNQELRMELSDTNMVSKSLNSAMLNGSIIMSVLGSVLIVVSLVGIKLRSLPRKQA